LHDQKPGLDLLHGGSVCRGFDSATPVAPVGATIVATSAPAQATDFERKSIHMRKLITALTMIVVAAVTTVIIQSPAQAAGTLLQNGQGT
jgi:hypothetical protein